MCGQFSGQALWCLRIPPTSLLSDAGAEGLPWACLIQVGVPLPTGPGSAAAPTRQYTSCEGVTVPAEQRLKFHPERAGLSNE